MASKTQKPLYEKETGWGVHEVVERYSRYAAQSRSHDGASGYLLMFDSAAEAMAYVDKRTQSMYVAGAANSVLTGKA